MPHRARRATRTRSGRAGQASPPLSTRPRGRLAIIDCDGSPAAARALSSAFASALDGTGPAVLPLPAGGSAATARERLLAALRPELPARERAALVIATSGSTGRPRGVELSGAALLASAAATHERLGGPGRWLLALPLQHIAGVQVLVRSLLSGHDPVVLDLRGGFDPGKFAAAAGGVASAPADALAGGVARLAGGAVPRWYTALVPTQLVRLLDAGGAGLDSLRGFDAVLIGGAACPPALAARARAAGVAVVTTYGMTETAGGCVYDGRPLDGVQVRIAPDGGRIELAGPMLALGYRLDDAATAAAWRDGWFRTDDSGRLTSGGLLDVLGRLDDVIVTGGRKVAPALVERALAAAPGVAQACVVGVPDGEWGQLVAAAVVPVDRATPPDEAVLRAAARDLAGPAAVPRLIRFLDGLPLAGPGKIDRAAVFRHFVPEHS